MKSFGDSVRANLSVRFVEMALLWVMTGMAGMTVLTQFSQILGISFRLYAFLGVGVFIGISGVFAKVAWKQHREHMKNDIPVLIGLVVLGLLASVLSIISHRPDADDYYYVPNAVYHLEHSTEPMDFQIHFLESGEKPIISYITQTALPFEYSQAVVAYVFRLNFLSVYYILSPALFGFLIPLAIYLLFSYFSTDTQYAAIATLLTLGAMLLMGETHRTFGNFLLTRIYHGKTVCLAIGIPLFVAATCRYFARPSLESWTVPFVVIIAMLGATTSSIILLPPLSVVLAIDFLIISSGKKATLKHIIFYFGAFVYSFGYVAFLWRASVSGLGMTSAANYDWPGWPSTFWGHLAFFYHDGQPVTIIIVIISTLLALVLSSAKVRIFLAVWIICISCLFLNPIVAPLLIQYVTTPNIYWRMMYLYPFPLVLGITIIAGLERMQGKYRWPVTIGLAALLTVLHIPASSPSVFKYRVTFGWPHEKLPPEALSIARKVVEVAPPGAMLAPEHVCGIIPMLSADHPQLRIRNEGFGLWFSKEEVQLRLQAAAFIQGDTRFFPAFAYLLESHHRLQSIVMPVEQYERADVQSILQAHNFDQAENIEKAVLVWKSQQG
jgi:hypothetical protein